MAKAAQTAGLDQLILTHISARFAPTPQDKGYSVEDIIAEARTHYDGVLHVAEDFDRFELDYNGRLIKTDA